MPEHLELLHCEANKAGLAQRREMGGFYSHDNRLNVYSSGAACSGGLHKECAPNLPYQDTDDKEGVGKRPRTGEELTDLGPHLCAQCESWEQETPGPGVDGA